MNSIQLYKKYAAEFLAEYRTAEAKHGATLPNPHEWASELADIVGSLVRMSTTVVTMTVDYKNDNPDCGPVGVKTTLHQSRNDALVALHMAWNKSNLAVPLEELPGWLTEMYGFTIMIEEHGV